MKVDAPSFGERTELTRFIDSDERCSGNRAAASAFLFSPEDFRDPSAHLSVNSLEVETIGEIANYYRSVFQDGDGEVAMCIHKVHRYIDGGRHAGVQVTQSADFQWVFLEQGRPSAAFKHRPIPPVRPKSRPPSPSHSGVEFLRSLDDVQQRKFARRMAQRPRFQVL
jgi:hypothetical protein